MPCSFGFQRHRRSKAGGPLSGHLQVAMTDRWIPLVTAACGTQVARPGKTMLGPGGAGSQADRRVRSILGNHSIVGKGPKGSRQAGHQALNLGAPVIDSLTWLLIARMLSRSKELFRQGRRCLRWRRTGRWPAARRSARIFTPCIAGWLAREQCRSPKMCRFAKRTALGLFFADGLFRCQRADRVLQSGWIVTDLQTPERNWRPPFRFLQRKCKHFSVYWGKALRWLASPMAESTWYCGLMETIRRVVLSLERWRKPWHASLLIPSLLSISKSLTWTTNWLQRSDRLFASGISAQLSTSCVDFLRVGRQMNASTNNGVNNTVGDSVDGLLPDTSTGLRDILELKRPDQEPLKWDDKHHNYYWAVPVASAIGQCHRYLDKLHEVGRWGGGLEDNSEIVAYHPRALIVIGRSVHWDNRKFHALHGLNSRLHGITVITYDQLLWQGEQALSVLESGDGTVRDGHSSTRDGPLFEEEPPWPDEPLAEDASYLPRSEDEPPI
jgi:hypothetical protein